MTKTDKQEAILEAARALHHRNADWVTFFRQILSSEGLVRRYFRTPRSLARFEQGPAYGEIRRMLAELRRTQGDSPNPGEETKVITVRLPMTLHEALKIEAHEYRTSMNALCITKLLQSVQDEGLS